jgi:hypothetical protein
MTRYPSKVGLLALAGVFTASAGWGQKDLDKATSDDFRVVIVKEIEGLRKNPVPGFGGAEAVFVVETARVTYDPKTETLTWRLALKPGAAPAAVTDARRFLRALVLKAAVEGKLVTPKQIDDMTFKVDILPQEAPVPPPRPVPGDKGPPPRPGPEGPPPEPGPPGPGAAPYRPGGAGAAPARPAPAAVGYTYYVPYCSYYPWYYYPYWGGCGWSYGPGWGYYPVSYYPAVAYYAAAPAAAAAPVVRTNPAPAALPPSRPPGTAPAVLGRNALAMAGREDEPPARRAARRMPTAGDPDALFWRGYGLYWEGRYADALEYLEGAVALRGQDPRYWSYKALAERKLGYDREASASARQAVALRLQNRPGSADVGTVLERVQGPDRVFLNAAADANGNP